MSIEKIPAPLIQNWQAALWLLVVLFGLVAGIWSLGQAQAQLAQDVPPYFAVLLLLLSAMALWFGRQEPELAATAVADNDDSQTISFFHSGFLLCQK